MITLHLGVGEGDVKKLEFKTTLSLLTFLKQYDETERIWVLTNDGEHDEIIISENFSFIKKMIMSEFFMLPFLDSHILFLQEYNSYEEAYKIALGMREPNPLCYDPEN